MPHSYSYVDRVPVVVVDVIELLPFTRDCPLPACGHLVVRERPRVEVKADVETPLGVRFWIHSSLTRDCGGCAVRCINSVPVELRVDAFGSPASRKGHMQAV